MQIRAIGEGVGLARIMSLLLKLDFKDGGVAWQKEFYAVFLLYWVSKRMVLTMKSQYGSENSSSLVRKVTGKRFQRIQNSLLHVLRRVN
jgi:hypothetical protein